MILRKANAAVRGGTEVPMPEDEVARLHALRELEILDTAPEQKYDDITLLASQICDAPISLISLIDEDRQWFKSKLGMVEAETPRDVSFCAHGILQEDVFVVEDATTDLRFADNPMVTGGPQVRFYAGSPLLTADGHAMGMLCVKDRKARTLSPKQKAALQALARQVVTQFELRRNLKALEKVIAERERAETELKQTHEKLLEASRRAGRAEVASSVLHNVGNVLNSVNVSSSLIAEKIRNSKVVNIAKAVRLMRERQGKLDEFLEKDPKGKQLLEYLENLAAYLSQEQDDVLHEVGSLVNNIVHIKEIVATQQNYANASGVLETLDVKALIEDAWAMNREAMERHKIAVIRHYSEVPAILTDKHRVLQILVNLIRNAKHACSDSDKPEKNITLTIRGENKFVELSVADDGIGIAPENLVKIFNHGFTTRKGGNGLGLHSGALTAKELGGELAVVSEGLGHGSTFTLRLPTP